MILRNVQGTKKVKKTVSVSHTFIFCFQKQPRRRAVFLLVNNIYLKW